jgi:hypothetical protein
MSIVLRPNSARSLTISCDRVSIISFISLFLCWVEGFAIGELLLFAFVPVLDGAEESDYAGVGFDRGGAHPTGLIPWRWYFFTG